MVSADEVIRRAVRMGYDVEILARNRRTVTNHYVSIFNYSRTAQPGYESVRLFHGNLPGAIRWVEEEEAKIKERAEAVSV